MNTHELHIRIDEFDLYYDLLYDDITTNNEKHISYIRSNKLLSNDYDRLCSEIRYFSNTCYKRAKKKGLFIRCILQDQNQNTNDNIIKFGGGPITAGIVVSSFVVSSVVAALLWYFLHPSEKCNEIYPLYPIDKIPDVGEIIETILPGNWIDDGLKSGKDLSEVINETGRYLDTLTEVFSIFDENIGDISTKIIKSVTKIGLSVGAAVLTVGMGGDKLVNIPYFISKAINMTTKTFNKLFEITTKISSSLQKFAYEAKNMQNKISNTFDKSLYEIENKTDEIRNKIKGSRNELAFIYDLFNVDFKHGPFHTVCWVDYIMDYYITNNKDNKDNANIDEKLLCLINDIYIEINESVIGFIGSAMDMIIPGSIGLAGTLTPLLKDYSHVLYSGVRDQFTDGYQQIPIEFRLLIQNPHKMSKYIFDKFNTYSLGLTDLIIPENVSAYMKSGIDILAEGLHKGLSITYMFLNVFIVFSKLNNNHNADLSLVLEQCVKCNDMLLTKDSQSDSYDLYDKCIFSINKQIIDNDIINQKQTGGYNHNISTIDYINIIESNLQ